MEPGWTGVNASWLATSGTPAYTGTELSQTQGIEMDRVGMRVAQSNCLHQEWRAAVVLGWGREVGWQERTREKQEEEQSHARAVHFLGSGGS